MSELPMCEHTVGPLPPLPGEAYPPAAVELPTVTSATVVRPGDRVLLLTGDKYLPRQEIALMHQALAEVFPDVVWLIMPGYGAQVIHQPAEAPGATE